MPWGRLRAIRPWQATLRVKHWNLDGQEPARSCYNPCGRSSPNLDRKGNTQALPYRACFYPWRARQGLGHSILGTSFGEMQVGKVLRSRIIGAYKSMSKSDAPTIQGGWLRSLNEGKHYSPRDHDLSGILRKVGYRFACHLQGVHTPLLPEHRAAVDTSQPH